ncbi:hypothetical protein INT45_005030 [Circinella minor]|uniref:Uncharacterized protein n=1 Tax=Circinella minor TaxID=1195481 RepID=A0A8H7RQD7_9FUNG|nr:hypothetical protein INT45_005030 [Circinella minor]
MMQVPGGVEFADGENHSHIEFVRNSCLVPTGFEPVKFFSHFQYKASARVFATHILKDTIEFLKNDEDEEIKDWAVQFSQYNYQVLETTFIDDYWLSVANSTNQTLQQTAKEKESQYRWELLTSDSYQATQKKRKTRPNDDRQENLKSTRKFDVKLLDEMSNDEVVVEWQNKSLGNILRTYTKEYVNKDVGHLSHTNIESLILLAQNNILNLVDRSKKGQKKLFQKAEWDDLKSRWLVEKEGEEFCVTKKMTESIINISRIARRNLEDGIDQVRSIYRKVPMTGDERNFYCFTHKLFEILERHSELFDEEKKNLTENDYVVRLWAPLLFVLFDDCRKLKLTWGESVLRGVGDESYYKVDLRVSFDVGKESFVLSTAEFAKNSNIGKLRSDHVKLLLEGNTLINNVKKYCLHPEISLLQCAGNEFDVLSMKAIDDHFTIATRPTQASRISNDLAPQKLIAMYSCFLRYKHTTIDFMNLLVSAADNIQTNTFDKAWGSNTNTSSQESTH